MNSQLEGVVDILDSVEEVLRPFYVEGDDGKYRLQVNGYVPKTKLDEFRNTNIELGKARTSLEEALSHYQALGEDPQELTKELTDLRNLRKRVDDKDLVDKKGFEAALEKRTAEMKAAADGQIKALMESRDQLAVERDQAIARHHRSVIDREITDAALGAGVLPTAIPDLLNRAERSGWVLTEKGKVVMKDDDGIAFGADGASALSPREWINGQLRDQAPHFFNQPSGGGSLGSGSSVNGAKNPWAKDSWNMTEQGRMVVENPAQAKRLAANAGVTLNI